MPDSLFHILPNAERMSPLTHPDSVHNHLKDEED